MEQIRKGLISLVQQGIIAQNEFAKFLMMGSDGLIELAAPLTDEERRDFEIHIHGYFGSALALQVKSAMQLFQLPNSAPYLRITFPVRVGRVVNNALFYYFFAYLDPVLMRFADPTFLIPSTVLHEQANPERKGEFWEFSFEASMAPGSHDKWVDYRVNTLDLGQKVVAIMRSQADLAGEGSEGFSGLLDLPDVVLIRKK